MKPILTLLLLAILASCKKEVDQPQQKCDYITDKYFTDKGYLVLGEAPPMGFGVTLSVSEQEYNSHKIGDYYCYSGDESTR